jgi:hypothetical protein
MRSIDGIKGRSDGNTYVDRDLVRLRPATRNIIRHTLYDERNAFIRSGSILPM